MTNKIGSYVAAIACCSQFLLCIGSDSHARAQGGGKDTLYDIRMSDAAVLLVQAQLMSRASRSIEEAVRNSESRRSVQYEVRRLYSATVNSQYLPKHLSVSLSSSPSVSLILVEVQSFPPIPFIVAFDHLRRPYRLMGFDSSDFALLARRMLLEDENHDSVVDDIASVYTSAALYSVVGNRCLIRSELRDSIARVIGAGPPRHKITGEALEIDFFTSNCIDEVEHHRLRLIGNAGFQYVRVASWPLPECWCPNH